MLKLPEKFKTQIINIHGKKGKEWLENIDKIIEKYKEKFQLENIELAEESNMNIVMFAKSRQFGEVVVKLGAPEKTAMTEIKVIKYYPSNCIPKCYASNLEDRIMILERILPGYPLNELEDRGERIKIFCQIANQLLLEPKQEEFPTFEGDLKEAIEEVYQNTQHYSNMIEMVNIASDIYQELQKKNLKKYILHEDLHHKNILKSEEGWKVIDPHGKIGERAIEVAQFIREEIKMSNSSEIDNIITLVCQHFKEDRKVVLGFLYINIIIRIEHYIKNKRDKNRISYNIEVAKKVLQLYKKEI